MSSWIFHWKTFLYESVRFVFANLFHFDFTYFTVRDVNYQIWETVELRQVTSIISFVGDHQFVRFKNVWVRRGDLYGPSSAIHMLHAFLLLKPFHFNAFGGANSSTHFVSFVCYLRLDFLSLQSQVPSTSILSRLSSNVLMLKPCTKQKWFVSDFLAWKCSTDAEKTP